MTRNTEQLTRTALAFLRQARDSGIADDDAMIEEAARLMGREFLPLIGRVHARNFKTFNPN